MKKISAILIVAICSCHQKNENVQKFGIKTIVFDVPPGMNFTEKGGVDSYSAQLTNKKDTFELEYGSPGIIYKFYYINPSVFPMSKKEKISKAIGKSVTPDIALFSDYPKEDDEQKIFDKNYFMYDTANDIVRKIVQPKRIGDGITGVYIPILKDGNSFSMYANNLDSNSHRQAIEIFKSIRYR